MAMGVMVHDPRTLHGFDERLQMQIPRRPFFRILFCRDNFGMVLAGFDVLLTH